MLKNISIAALFAICLTPGELPAFALPPVAVAPAQAQGAKDLEELGGHLHNALQTGSLDGLQPFLLNQQSYDKLLKQSPPQLRATLDLVTAEDISKDFQNEFATVVQDGVTAEINWAQTRRGGTSQNQGQTKSSHGIIPVALQLSDQNNRQHVVTFEAVKVGNRYFFYQQVRFGEV